MKNSLCYNHERKKAEVPFSPVEVLFRFGHKI